MEQEKKKKGLSFKYWVAAGFILAGLLLLGKNLGVVSAEVFGLLVSWQMLLIVLGLYMLLNRQYIRSFLLIAIGVYFLTDLNGYIPESLTIYYWPLILIVIGLVFIFKKRIGGGKHHHNGGVETQEMKSEDGYFHIENKFGGVQQVITDEVIYGGSIKTSFGGTVVDLRRTSLPEGKTYLEVDVRFGGIELHVPSTWNVKSEIKPFVGAVDDARLVTLPTENPDRWLIIKGEISVGGIEIKS